MESVHSKMNYCVEFTGQLCFRKEKKPYNISISKLSKSRPTSHYASSGKIYTSSLGSARMERLHAGSLL